MFTMCGVLQSNGYTAAVVLDTDNYVKAINIAQRILGILCLKRKLQLIDAQVFVE